VNYVRTLAIALAAVAALLFAQEAHGQGCRVGQAGCSVQAAGCSVQAAGCSVQAVPAAVSANDVVTFRPRPRTAAPVTQTQPQVVQGPAGPAGPQGPAGPPGPAFTLTPELARSLVIAVKNELLAAIKTDPTFRGTDGMDGKDGKDAEIDIDAVAAAAAKLVPTPEVNVNAIASAAASQIDLAKIAELVKVEAAAPVAGPNDIVYVTAKGQPQLVELDKAVYALKAQGSPIIVVKLDPRDTSVHDVPKVHNAATKQTISGLENVAKYVAALRK
jgi:hypothetical protein